MESRRVVVASIFVTGWQQKHCYKVTAETLHWYRVTANTNTFLLDDIRNTVTGQQQENKVTTEFLFYVSLCTEVVSDPL